MINEKSLPKRERPVDQMVSSFRGLLLNGAENRNLQPAPSTSTGQGNGGDITDVLTLPWRHQVPTPEDCDTIVKHYNLTLDVMKNTHEAHLRRAGQMRPGSGIMEYVGPIPPLPLSFQDYIFNCSICYDMFALLYASIYSPSEASRPRPESSDSGFGSDASDGAGPSDTNARKRRSSWPNTNLPAISINCSNVPMSLDLIMPTSTFLNFYESAQQLSKKANPQSNAVPMRSKKFSRNRKDVAGYQRRQKKY